MLAIDKPLLDTFTTVQLRINDLDLSGRFTRNLASDQASNYRLRNHKLLGARSDDILGVRAGRREGDLWPCYNADSFGVDIEIVGLGHPRYCLTTALSGAIEMAVGPNGTAACHGATGIVYRGLPDTRLRMTDGSVRFALWIDAGRLERALHAQLGEPPREILAFSPGIDWSSGRAGAVWRMIAHLVDELRDPDGMTADPIAREAFTDMFAHTVLSRLEHNYTARLQGPMSPAIPGHLRRALSFMHASADRPLALADIAAAAGCGTRTLHAAFRQFRDTTPLAALHDIRLRRARDALRAAGDQEPTRAIARRFGFTNPSRFIAAYGKRFGEHPNETRRRE